MAADKLIRMLQKIFSQNHREKLRFAARKSKLDFKAKPANGYFIRGSVYLTACAQIKPQE